MPALIGLGTGALAALAAGGLWALAPALMLVGAGVGALRFRDAGWALEGPDVAIRSRVLSRSTLVARAARLQQAELRASVLQRRADLATTGLAVGAGRRAHVAHLEAPVARALLERLRAAPSRTGQAASPGVPLP